MEIAVVDYRGRINPHAKCLSEVVLEIDLVEQVVDVEKLDAASGASSVFRVQQYLLDSGVCGTDAGVAGAELFLGEYSGDGNKNGFVRERVALVASVGLRTQISYGADLRKSGLRQSA